MPWMLEDEEHTEEYSEALENDAHGEVENQVTINLAGRFRRGQQYRTTIAMPREEWRDFLSVLEFRLAVGSAIWRA